MAIAVLLLRSAVLGTVRRRIRTDAAPRPAWEAEEAEDGGGEPLELEEEEEGAFAEEATAQYGKDADANAQTTEAAALPRILDDPLPRKRRRVRPPRYADDEGVGAPTVSLRAPVLSVRERPYIPSVVRFAARQAVEESRRGGEVLSENLLRLSRGGGASDGANALGNVNADERTGSSGRRRRNSDDAERVHYRGAFGRLMEKRGHKVVAGESVIDSAAFMCKHMNDCDQFNAKVAKLHQKEREAKNLEVKRHERQVRLSESWGGRVASMGSVFDVCQMQGASTAAAEAEVVRRCTRAVLKEMRLKDVDAVSVRTAVTAHLGIELSKTHKNVIANEVSQLTRGGSVESVQKKFMEAEMLLQQQALDEADMDWDPRGANGEERDDNGMTEEMRRAVAHSWRARNNTEDAERNVERWSQLERSGVRFLVSAAQARSPANATDAAPRCSLFTHLRQFLCADCPVPKAGDLLSWNDVKPVILVRASHAYGEATHRYEFPKAVLKLLPVDDRRAHYASCAVVGNTAGLLKGTQYGFHIDTHDAVFRVNYAPTKGFEVYVGERTTYDVVSAALAKKLIDGTASPHRLVNSTMVLYDTTSEMVRRTLVEAFVRQFSGVSLERSHALLLSPDLASAAAQAWEQLENAIASTRVERTRAGEVKAPQAFIAAFVALQMCDAVHLYGFHTPRGKRSALRYFDTMTVSLTPEDRLAREAEVHHTYEALRQASLWPGSDARYRLRLHKG